MSRTVLIVWVGVLLAQPAWTMEDPTRPSAYRAQVSVARDYELQSVLLSGARRIAFVNGKALSVGDSLGSAKVVSIDRDRVILRSQGREIALQAGRTTVTRKEQWLVSD